MPARFTIRLTPSFVRDLEALPTSAQDKILPFTPPPKIKKLRGKGVGQWRLEVWPYRMRYDVVGQDVVLYRVRHRKDIYRD